MARLGTEDWLDMGLRVLAQKGYANLRLEYLCGELQVTRGSFYHHFQDINDYIDQLMAYWEKNSIAIMQKAGETEGSPLDKLNQLQRAVFKIPAKLEVVIRAWATFNPTVLEYIRKIDRRRIKFITGLYEETGVSRQQAETTARIEYATYIGVQNLYFMESPKKAEALYREFEHRMIRSGKR